MRKISFKIYTLGCKVNQYDSAKFKADLITAGFKLVLENADVSIINTCTVTKTAIRKCRQMIKGARAENPKAKIVVAGCWPKIYRNDVKKTGVDLIWVEFNNVNPIKKLLKIQISKPKLQINSKYQNPNYKVKTSDKSRYFLKIQDGCEQFCSYCIIPYTRGKLRSRPATEVIAEARAVIKAGFEEIVLCGIHLGLYGKEKVEGDKPKEWPSLTKLLKKLLAIERLGRIRLSSIEVTEVDDDLIELMRKNKKICPHLHIPLQSGSDKILRLMNRPYDVKYYKNKIKKIRQALPDIAITTDVIVGFPGEAETDFKNTRRFIKDMEFSRLHVFPYSEHDKTAAAGLPDKVEAETTAKRASELRKLGEKLRSAYENKFNGKELAVMVEKIEKGFCTGKTEYYFEVTFKKARIIYPDTELEKVSVRRGQIVKIIK